MGMKRLIVYETLNNGARGEVLFPFVLHLSPSASYKVCAIGVHS